MRNQLPRAGGPNPSPDEVSGGRAEGVQSVGVQPASGIEVLPGYTFPTDPPTTSPRVDAVSARLDALEDHAAEVERRLFESLANRVVGLEDTQRHINAVLEGSVGTTLERVNGVALKLAKKLNKSADQRLSNAYSYALELGGHYPAREDVIYGLQTGDYLGSMGVSPPAPSLPTGGTSAAPPGTQGAGGWETLPGGGGGIELPPPDEPPDEPGPFGPPSDLPPPAPSPVPTTPPGQGIVTCSFGGPLGTAVDGFAIPLDCDLYIAWVEAGFPDFIPAMYPDGNCVLPLLPGPGTCSYTMGLGPMDQPTSVVGPGGVTFFVSPDGGQIFMTMGAIPPGMCAVGSASLCGTPGDDGGTGTPGDGAGKTCPTPNTNPCTPGATFVNVLSELPGGEDVCAMMEQALTQSNAVPPQVGDWIKMAAFPGLGGSMVDSIISAITGGNEPILTSLVNRFGSWLQKGAEAHARDLKCGDQQAIPLAVKQAIFGLVNQWTGSIPPPVMTFLNQMWAWLCPTQMPSSAEVDQAWLADGIDDKEWECWHKMQGDHLQPAKKLVDTKRARVDVLQADLLRRRGYIDSDTFLKRARALGVIRDEDALDFTNLNNAWPGMADVIRFMVRDVEDEDIVQFSKLDEDFELKWTGMTEKYGEALGIDKDLAKRYWRAHWQVPSFHQLGEMLHRNRDGRVDPALVVTEEDVRKALKQDDWAPGWIDRMMAISYRPITRTDAQRMYELHAIEEQDLQGYYQDEGYNEKDAKALVEGNKRRRHVAEVKRSGLPTARTLINQYSRGEVTSREFRQVAQEIAYSDEQSQSMQDSAELARTVRNRTMMIKGIKANYLHGVIDDPEAHEALSDAGVDGDEVSELVMQWALERSARGKMPAAAQLCKWRGMGLIGPADQARALVRIGWDSDDAYRIVTQCETELDDKQKQAAAKAAKAAARQLVQQRVETVRQCTERQKAKKGDPCADPLPRPVPG